MGAIYCITNRVNGKRYVGQTTRKNARARYGYSRTLKAFSGQRRLYYSIRKHGIHNFQFDDLELEVPQDRLDERERHYIDLFRTRDPRFGYNIEGGGNTRKQVPKETRDRIAAKHRGKRLSQEHRTKLSTILRGSASARRLGEWVMQNVKGKPMDEAHRRSISEARTGKPLPASQQGDSHPQARIRWWHHPRHGFRFCCCKRLADEFNLNARLLGDVARGKFRQHRDWIFVGADPDAQRSDLEATVRRRRADIETLSHRYTPARDEAARRRKISEALRRTPRYNAKVRHFVHPDYGEFVGTASELARRLGLQPRLLNHVANGIRAHHRGWRIKPQIAESAVPVSKGSDNALN